MRGDPALPLGRRGVGGAVAPLECAALFLADGGQVLALAFGVGVLADGACGHVVGHAGGGELAAEAHPADVLLQARPHKGRGEALVIEPLFVAQAGDGGLDHLALETLR